MSSSDLRSAIPSASTRARKRPSGAAITLGLDVVALVVAVAALSLPARWSVFFVAASLTSLAVQGSYRRRFTTGVGGDLGRLALAVAAPAVVGGAIVGSEPTASLLARASLLSAGLLLVGRSITGLMGRALSKGTTLEPTVIVGAGTFAVRLVRHLREHPEYGLAPVGFLDEVEDTDLPLPVLGEPADLAAVVRAVGARHVIVAYGQVRDTDLVDVVRNASGLDVPIWTVPRLFELGAAGGRTDDLWGIPVTRLPQATLRRSQFRVKRGFDVVVSAVALAVLAPVLAVVTVAVKLSSPGPVFFRQRRVGQHGRPIDILKFRTMRVNDDDDSTWNVTDDDRVTRVGRILRPTSLDELPQLLNVIKGDLSLVGPRPERPRFVDVFSSTIPRYDHRHRVPVGITGLAQVHGLRGDTSIEDRAAFDNHYIEHWSLWLDVRILVRTIWSVVRPPASVVVTAPSTQPATEVDHEPAQADVAIARP